MTFAVIRKTVDDIVSVPEEAIIEATRLLFEAARVVVEPSGALGLAALLTGAARAQGRVGLILSGGNIDAPMMARILHSGR
jgi:threonine dehydratase